MIENSGEEACLTLPFDGTDILTDKTFEQGECIEMKPYDCLFIKKA